MSTPSERTCLELLNTVVIFEIRPSYHELQASKVKTRVRVRILGLGSRLQIWELSTPSERPHLGQLNATIIFEIGPSYHELQAIEVKTLTLVL